MFHIFKRLIEMMKYFVKKFFFFLIIDRSNSLNKIFINSESMILFITHNFKGGTIQYENNFIQENNCNVIVLKLITHGKILAYSLENKLTNEKILLNNKSFSVILNYKFQKIIVNSLVSANNIKELCDVLKSYKIKYHSIPLYYLVHDFHCICPKYNLIEKNRYCNLDCNTYKCKFHYYPDCTTMSVNVWRDLWASFLTCVDKVICFSRSSKELILEAYPRLGEEKIFVNPHSMDWCRFTKIKQFSGAQLHVAIVGKVDTIPKGKIVVQEILSRTSSVIPFYLIGTTANEIKSKRKNISYFGKYKHDQLQSILENLQINLVVFPSICPETFSYLISELIMMDLPIVCLDCGAQAEKVKNYNKGVVVKDIENMINYIEEANQKGVCYNEYN